MTAHQSHTRKKNTVFFALVYFLLSQVPGIYEAHAAGGPDLSTGTMSYSIPIEVPAGRKGMAPALALSYRSGGGDGWVGVGWELETGSIERNTKNGLFYDDRDTFVLRMGGGAIELVNISGNEYRAKIEGSFIKVTRVRGSGEGGQDYWIAKDKSGTQYVYGSLLANRQFDAADAGRIFKWCLDQVTDTFGNYVIFTYSKDNGQIYIDRIDYTGNTDGTGTTKYVKFYSDNGIDSPEKYDTKFKVKTTKRLKTIATYYADYPLALVKVYKLSYRNSADTGRSLLISVQLFGSDAALDMSSSAPGTVLDGTALPATIFDWQTNEPKVTQGWTASTFSNGPSSAIPIGDQCLTGDLNGDGKADFWCETVSGGGSWSVALSGAAGWTTERWDSGPAPVFPVSDHCFTGDLNADGKTEFWCKTETAGSWTVAGWTDTGWSRSTWGGGPVLVPGTTASSQCFTGDIEGDGRTDFWCETGSGTGKWNIASSTGSAWIMKPQQDTSANGPKPAFPIHDHCFTGDLDGDGRTDFWCENSAGGSSWKIALATVSGTNFSWSSLQWDNGPTVSIPVGSKCLSGDLNGDGKTDVWCQSSAGSWSVALSTGSGWSMTSPVSGPSVAYSAGGQCLSGDLNGDGKTDFWCETEPGAASWNVALTKGAASAFWDVRQWSGGPARSSSSFASSQCFPGDVNGDGMTDFWCESGSGSGSWNVAQVSGRGIPDLLTSIKNGMGSTTTITYTPSSQYSDNHIPFPMYTVSSVSSAVLTNDGSSLSSNLIATTDYEYFGGYYHVGERDLRGFNRIKITGPASPDGVRIITETWFHRGNDTRTVTDIFTPQGYSDDPTGTDGYMKGRPYFTRVTDSTGQLHSVSTTVYYPAASLTPPYFTPDRETNSYSCDDGICDRHIRAVNTYDNTYGNLLRSDDYGDVNDPNDDRTIVRTYAVNASAWIVGLPSSETAYKGIGTAEQISSTTYHYDGVPPVGTSCGSASFTGNEIPDRGLVTRVVRWLDPKQEGETDLEDRMAYDKYGNLACVWDAKGNPPTFFSYDGTLTYRRKATNPLHHVSETKYYGVDNESVANGFYGQVKSSIDPNGTTVESQYDKLGRKVANSYWPEDTWNSWTYPKIASATGNTYGAVGAQHVQTDNIIGIKTWTYFDGLGRTILEKKSGPNGSTIEVRTAYNANGSVKEKTMPAFTGASNLLKATFTYDALGRTTGATSPDGTTFRACYRGSVTVGINADKHRKRETRDARGRLIKVEEYLGIHESCSTEEGSPYATTAYEYDRKDLKGNLLKVIDTASNATRMWYDSLGRKISMQDPDMGDWYYQYDRNGNLSKQTDANGQTISFTYDALDRIKLKDYPTGADVEFRYDELSSTYAIGRLTTMIDASGTTTYRYDYMGRPVTMTKHIDNAYYSITTGYEDGRMTSVTYPDGEVVRYSYGTGSELAAVRNGGLTYNYAVFPARDYTALSQPTFVHYGNGVETTYDFYSENNRLKLISTMRSAGTETLLGLTYEYYAGGNIRSIDDLSTSPSITSPGMAVFYTYNPNDRPHAVRSSSDGGPFDYDNNGNMVSDRADRVRNITYDYDNRLLSMVTSKGTTTFVYDGAGARVKKIGPYPYGETVYIGKYYQCRAGTCTKYIFGGGARIANQSGTNIEYYHLDHLGSTRFVTGDVISEDKGSLTYYPFGEILAISGALGDVAHKYTSQELDTETDLYFYNARYYNPALGRFISPDTQVPGASNPQALNRYSYVLNNPLSYTDPTGHRSWRRTFKTMAKFTPLGASWELKKYNDKLLMKYAAVQMIEGIASNFTPIGAFGGAAFAGYMTHLNGGGWEDVVMSAGISGASSAIFQGLGEWHPAGLMEGAGKIAFAGGFGGSFSVVQGGKFGRGFAFAAGAEGANQIYRGYTNSEFEKGNCPKCKDRGPTFASGEGSSAKAWNQNVWDPDMNNFGLSYDAFTADIGGWNEGGQWSQRLNMIPGMNAIAVMHDIVSAGAGPAWFVGSMLYSGVTTYSALLTGNPAIQLAVGQSQEY